jgi:hypothetical protein
LLFLGRDQVQKLEIATDVAIGHGDAHVLEVLFQREQTTLVAHGDEPCERFFGTDGWRIARGERCPQRGRSRSAAR